MVTRSLPAAHIPLLVVLIVNVTDPKAISAADGIYVAFSVWSFGKNVPLAGAHCAVVPVAFNCIGNSEVQTV